MNTNRLKAEKLNGLISWSKAENALGANIPFAGSADEKVISELYRLNKVVNRKLFELIAEYDPVSGNDAPQDIDCEPNLMFFKGLTHENILSLDLLMNELELFDKHYSLDKDNCSKAFVDDIEAVFAWFINSKDYFANQYMIILLKYLLRFVSADINFSQSTNIFSYSAERMAIQKVVTGDTRYFIGICGEKAVLQELNDSLKNSFAPGEQNYIGHNRYDSLLTLINCVSCIFQSLIEKEKEINMVDNPVVYKYSTVSANENCSLLPVTVGEVHLDLLVGFGYRPNFANISHNI
ncbi:MAG: hypothetical protein FWD34_05150 [Oscillospiraceae bacterium]|nr:hypothetical protein [Oscillospiraceae bacterium]